MSESKLTFKGIPLAKLPREEVHLPADFLECRKVERWARYFYTLHLVVQESERLDKKLSFPFSKIRIDDPHDVSQT